MRTGLGETLGRVADVHCSSPRGHPTVDDFVAQEPRLSRGFSGVPWRPGPSQPVCPSSTQGLEESVVFGPSAFQSPKPPPSPDLEPGPGFPPRAQTWSCRGWGEHVLIKISTVQSCHQVSDGCLACG